MESSWRVRNTPMMIDVEGIKGQMGKWNGREVGKELMFESIEYQSGVNEKRKNDH